MVDAEKSEYVLMKWLPDNAIDKRLFRLIDPKQPLHKGDIFLPSMDFSIVGIVWLSFWLCLFTTGIVGISYELINKLMLALPAQESKGVPPGVSVILFLIFGFGVFRVWGSLRSMLIRRQLFKQGRYRNGMFILNDAILIHSMSQIFYVEKKYISNFHIIPKGRGEPPELLMVMQKNEDERAHVNLYNLNLEHSAYTLNKSLVNWINTGEWELKIALSSLNMPEIN